MIEAYWQRMDSDDSATRIAAMRSLPTASVDLCSPDGERVTEAATGEAVARLAARLWQARPSA